jgi:hypothetical protein
MRLALVSTRRVKRLLAEQALDQGDTLTAFVSDWPRTASQRREEPGSIWNIGKRGHGDSVRQGIFAGTIRTQFPQSPLSIFQ